MKKKCAVFVWNCIRFSKIQSLSHLCFYVCMYSTFPHSKNRVNKRASFNSNLQVIIEHFQFQVLSIFRILSHRKQRILNDRYDFYRPLFSFYCVWFSVIFSLFFTVFCICHGIGHKGYSIINSIFLFVQNQSNCIMLSNLTVYCKCNDILNKFGLKMLFTQLILKPNRC